MDRSTWNIPGPAYDLAVVGAGHAGIEAALAGARMGMRTVLLTMSLQTIGQMSCNPAIGGLGKGHLVRELDALGGEMARCIDRTGIQFRLLNRSKGAAVWSPRAQADKQLYAQEMTIRLMDQEGLDLRQGMVVDIEVRGGQIAAVVLGNGTRIPCRTLVLCNGTFLNGMIHVGRQQEQSGRAGEPPAVGLSQALAREGVEVRRFKTGTPPRVDRASIDFSALEEQPGDEVPQPFRYYENLVSLPQQSCWLAWTDESCHDLLRGSLDLSPMYSGQIESEGPRYCPSIEDKVVRFADKGKHQIFLEPESLTSREMYVNGFSTSMPEEVQWAALRTVPGFEEVRLTRPGYAIEYDYFPSWQINHRLQSTRFPNLFLAGQINGTSGYEEAASQGFLAAANARAYLNREPEGFQIRRDQGYLGVMIDDLVSKDCLEPYRMFTSRAEFRLLLRQDNADERLMTLGKGLGTLEQWRYEEMLKRKKQKEELRSLLLSTRCRPAELGFASKSTEKQELAKLLKRPEATLREMLCSWKGSDFVDSYSPETLLQIEFDLKYEGYVQRQEEALRQFARNEDSPIPEGIDFLGIETLSTESRQRLDQIRPANFGQASRISGVRPADLTALWIHVQKANRSNDTA